MDVFNILLRDKSDNFMYHYVSGDTSSMFGFCFLFLGTFLSFFWGGVNI